MINTAKVLKILCEAAGGKVILCEKCSLIKEVVFPPDDGRGKTMPPVTHFLFCTCSQPTEILK